MSKVNLLGGLKHSAIESAVLGSGKVAQSMQALTTKPDDLSFVPKRESMPASCPLTSPNVLKNTDRQTDQCKILKYLKKLTFE